MFVYSRVILAFVLTAILTIMFTMAFYTFGRSGNLGNLFSPVRGGIPRGIGLAPFLALLLFLPLPYNFLVFLIGISAFVDDVIGRKKIYSLHMEVGQLIRGIGMVSVAVFGYYLIGPSSFIIALMIQPMNIADMQPGSACSTTIILSLVTAILSFLLSKNPTISLIVLTACLAYCPLDYAGNIMMGEVGNHSIGVALGISFFILGGLVPTIIMFFITVLLVALVRRNNLREYLENNLNIPNPTLGDYFMDVLTGGGLGDLLRKFILGKKQIYPVSRIWKILGFRRLLYNPHAFKSDL